MTVLSSQTEEAYLDSIKERALHYKNLGYSVIIAPESDQVPDFLKDFSVDLMAKSEQENVIVEIKSRQSLRENLSNIDKLDELIKAHPGWRFELVLLKDEPKLPPEANPKIIITEVERLQNSSYSDAALLLLWGAIEIGLRRIANRENLELDQESIDYLIKNLVSLGLLEDEVYKVICEARKVRNEVAHGFEPTEDTKILVNKLLPIARTLV